MTVLPLGIGIQRIISNIFVNNNEEKEKVYVVGNGWSSYYFVKNLNKNKFEPIIIAPNSKVLNTPKLTNLLTDANSEVEFENPYGGIILDMVEDIDMEKKKLITKSGSTYKYNKVVLAIGSEPNDFGIPGVQINTYKFKTIPDANILREKLETCTKNSQIYVIGSGVTGIELASKISNISRVKVIEGLGTILPGYNDNTKDIILKHLKQTQKLIDVETNTMVKYVINNQIGILKNDTKKNLNLDYNQQKDIIIWTGGVRICGYGSKTLLFNKLNQITPIKPRGLDVEEDFALKQGLDLYCIGDMVANKGPPTAQNARHQGEWLANYFNSDFDKNYLKTNKFESKSKGKLVHLIADTYLESDYYSGFIPRFIDKLIEWINK